MREIKFKLWDTRLKCFHELDDIYEILIGNISHIFTNRQNSGTFWDREDFEKRFKIIQYTGLKDKNGKEIYEGDIVKCVECENYFRDSKTERIILVELYFDTSISRYSSGGPDGSIWYEDIELIGNIYENPELLEKQDDNTKE